MESVTLTIDNGDGCGGYYVHIEASQNNVSCETKITTKSSSFSAGDVLKWTNEDLGECNHTKFMKSASEINYKLKTTSNDFCPGNITIFMKDSKGILTHKYFKSGHNHNNGYYGSEDNDIINSATDVCKFQLNCLSSAFTVFCNPSTMP